MQILAISGSLRAASINTALLRATMIVAPSSITVSLYAGLRSLPPFDPDVEMASIDDPSLMPASVAAFGVALRAADAVIFSTPEYAHGLPGVLKNALDWVVGSGEFVGKRVAIFNASAYGTFAHASLLETLTVMSARVVADAAATCTTLHRSMTDMEIVADVLVAHSLTRALDMLAASVRAG